MEPECAFIAIFLKDGKYLLFENKIKIDNTIDFGKIESTSDIYFVNYFPIFDKLFRYEILRDEIGNQVNVSDNAVIRKDYETETKSPLTSQFNDTYINSILRSERKDMERKLSILTDKILLDSLQIKSPQFLLISTESNSSKIREYYTKNNLHISQLFAIDTFERLFDITSTLNCCATIPDAAVHNALIIS